MRPTISLLILPTSTISTISTVSSSVTRMPPTNVGSLPSRFMSAPICGPPPWTMTGLMPTRCSRMTSSANGSLRSAWSMAAPPYLMTTDFPRNSRMYGSASMRISTGLTSLSITGWPRRRLRLSLLSQDVSRKVRVPPDVGEPLSDVLRVDRELLARQVRGVERDIFQELLHHRVQAPRADVLRALVHAHGNLGDGLHRLRQDVERDAFRLQQLHVLPHQRVPRLGQDADEILPRQGLELHADREPALELGNQVRRLGDVEGPGGDEEDMVGADDPVLGGDRRALHHRQGGALPPPAPDVRAVGGALASGHLVELVQEHDPGVLDAADRPG